VTAIPTAASARHPDDGAAWYKPRGYLDYRAAEKEAGLMAGDTGLAMGIVKNYDNPGWLLVMSLDDAEAYIAAHDDDPDGARNLYQASAAWAEPKARDAAP
jgi:hypothetical protein